MQLVERDVGVRVRLQVGDVLRHLIGGGVGGEVAGRHRELRGRLGAGGELDEFPRVGDLLLVRVPGQPEVRAADEHAADGLVQHAGQIRHADLEVRAVGDGGQLSGGVEGDGGSAGDEGGSGAGVVHAEVVADALVHQALPALQHQLAAAVGVVLDRGGHTGAAVLVVDVVVVGAGEQILKEPAVDGQAHRILRVALHARHLIRDRLDFGEGGRNVRDAGLLEGGLVVVHHRGGGVDRDAHHLAVHGVVVAQHALDLVKGDVRVLVEHVLEGNDIVGAGEIAGAQLKHLEHVRALAGGQRGLQLGQRVVVGALELGDHLDILVGLVERIDDGLNGLADGAAEAVPEGDGARLGAGTGQGQGQQQRQGQTKQLFHGSSSFSHAVGGEVVLRNGGRACPAKRAQYIGAW